MILKSPFTKLGIVNLLSDFILSKIPNKQLSIIQVVDCKNFLVIKGQTSSDEVLDFSKIMSEFEDKYHDFLGNKSFPNLIELIEYDMKMTPKTDITHSYFNTTSCSYNFSQVEKFTSNNQQNYDDSYVSYVVEEPLAVSSTFPHGYSINMGRDLYYFGKHIVYNIPPTSPFTKLTLSLSWNQNEFRVFDDFDNSYDDKLTSAIKDCINFDSLWMESEMKKVDFCLETTNPLDDFEFLKKINKDLIIF